MMLDSPHTSAPMLMRKVLIPLMMETPWVGVRMGAIFRETGVLDRELNLASVPYIQRVYVIAS